MLDQRVVGSNLGSQAVECNPGQVVYTHAPLSPNSIIGTSLPSGNVTIGLASR